MLGGGIILTVQMPAELCRREFRDILTAISPNSTCYSSVTDQTIVRAPTETIHDLYENWEKSVPQQRRQSDNAQHRWSAHCARLDGPWPTKDD
jgi:hypothetical protein